MKLVLGALVLLGTFPMSTPPEPYDNGGEPKFKSAKAKAAHNKFKASLQKAREALEVAQSKARETYLRDLGKAFKGAVAADDIDEALTIKLEQRLITDDLKSAAAIRTLLASNPAKRYREHVWKAGDPPLKLITAGEGFCFLSGVGGAFQGAGEGVHVSLRDGKWWLEGHSAQPSVWARAISVRLR